MGAWQRSQPHRDRWPRICLPACGERRRACAATDHCRPRGAASERARITARIAGISSGFDPMYLITNPCHAGLTIVNKGYEFRAVGTFRRAVQVNRIDFGAKHEGRTKGIRQLPARNGWPILLPATCCRYGHSWPIACSDRCRAAPGRAHSYSRRDFHKCHLTLPYTPRPSS